MRIHSLPQLQEQRVSAKEDEQDEEEEDEAEREEDIVLAKQLAWAEHRIKELEALIGKAVRPYISHRTSALHMLGTLKLEWGHKVVGMQHIWCGKNDCNLSMIFCPTT